MTRGSQPVTCATRTHVWIFDVEQLPLESIRDTTGAGDAFLAGFLSQLMGGRSLSDCVAAGNCAAKMVIAQTGCRLP